ncbi:MAG: hypothetical protein WA208_01480 [Thermoanaerobaculia bacterium]
MKRLFLTLVVLLVACSAFAQATVAVQPAAPVFEKLVVTNVSISFAAKEPGAPLLPQPAQITVTYQLFANGESKYGTVNLVGAPEDVTSPPANEASAALRAFITYSGAKPEGLISRKRLIDWLIAAGKIDGVTADAP